MSFTQEEINYYHDRGMMPDRIWSQQNERSAFWNWKHQHNKLYGKLAEHEAAKRRKEVEREIERKIFTAIVSTLEQGSELIMDAAADDIIAGVNAALTGSPAPMTKRSFSADLGAILGRALGEAPFKLLEEFFNGEADRRRD